MAKSFYIATFGCRTNQADSAALRQGFVDRRYVETGDSSEADVIVVNSCTVTHRSDQQVRQLTRRLRRENSKARLIVTGCSAQRDPQSLARIEGVDAVLGNTFKSKLVEIAQEDGPSHDSSAVVYAPDFLKSRRIDPNAALQVGGKTRPFVKVQDGCDAKCSYCIIPSVRGPSRSVPPQQVLAQVRGMVEAGFQEIVLTGIHIGTYGMHLTPRFPLDRLIAEMLETPGLRRLRISSIEPMELSKRIIDLAAEDSRIAPHFHICLQSGCDSVLRRMLRPYDSKRFAGIVERIRERIPDAAIGTDIIVGFPGETSREHQVGLDFVDRMPFTYLHVFPYSDRPGTAASVFPSKVIPPVQRGRCRDYLDLSDRKSAAFRRSFLGRRLSALTLTDLQGGFRAGLTANYIKAKLDPGLEGNLLVEGVAVAEEGESLILQTSPRNGDSPADVQSVRTATLH